MDIKEYHTYIAQNNTSYTVENFENGRFYYKGNPMWFPNGKYCHQQGKHGLDLLYEISYVNNIIKTFCDVIDEGLYVSLSIDKIENLNILIKEVLDAN